jgi:Preprotein translocase SecG subunit.
VGGLGLGPGRAEHSDRSPQLVHDFASADSTRQRRGIGVGLLAASADPSAFGSRAGDMFTRITLIVAGIWLLLAMVQVVVLQGTYEETKGEGGTTIMLPVAEK